ncbi:MAG: type I glyceraldehyde-3-phosphate dehydrogenase [bacterium]
MKIAINGFGRIGRPSFKIALENKNVEIVAINDLTDNKTLANLLQYDTAYGKYGKEVTHDDDHLIVDGKKYIALSEPDPTKLPWKDLNVDVVLECTGVFRDSEGAMKHISAGAKTVLLSAPGKSKDIQTFVKGVNNDSFDKENNKIVSNASCTTNCIAPVMAVLQNSFGVAKAFMTTVHSYTADQNIVDGPHKDLRRGRTAGQNIVPTTTGAAIATTKTIPKLEGKFDGMAIRIPTQVGSLSDITAVLSKDVTVEDINKVLTEASKNPIYKGILEVTSEAIVSSDIIANPHSAIVDLSFTKVVGGNLVKVLAWYDNEWGYSNRLIEIAEQFGK